VSNSAVATVYAEELKAITRGRFAWIGGAVVMIGIGGLAAVASRDTWLDGYGYVAYYLAPIAFLPLTAAAIAGPRANGFVESLFTAPVERRDWLAAKILVVLTLAVAFYFALLPMMLVYVAHVGTPFLLAKFLVWTPGILVASVAIGTLVGVLFIGRTVAPPVATGVGLMLVFAVLVPLQELLVARGYGSTATGHIAVVSPLVLLKNALGFTLAAGTMPASALGSWLSFLLVVVGAFALAAWVFLRVQGVDSWEARPSHRVIIATAILGLVLVPIAFGDADYDRPAPPANNAPAIPGLFLRGGGALAMVDPAGKAPDLCCDTLMNRDRWPAYPIGQASRQDLLLLLPVSTEERLTRIGINVVGQSGLRIEPDPDSVSHALDHLETRSYPADLGPADAAGHHIRNGWVARIPVSFTPTQAWDIGGVRYPIDVSASYAVQGDPQPRTLTARAAIEAQVPSALAEMSTAGAIVPLLCLFAAFRRWRKTR